MSAVDQAYQLNRDGSAEVDERIKGCANGPAGVQHVVDQDHGLIADVDGDRGWAQRAWDALVDIIAIQRDVQLAQGQLDVFELPNPLSESPRERDSARSEADQDKVVGTAIALNDFMSQARDRAANVVGTEQLLLARFGHGHSFAVSRGRN